MVLRRIFVKERERNRERWREGVSAEEKKNVREKKKCPLSLHPINTWCI